MAQRFRGQITAADNSISENPQYNSVREMIRDISDDEAFNRALEEQISKRGW